MKKYIICCSSSENTGKTSVIFRIFNLLKKDDGIVRFPDDDNGQSDDLYAIMEYKNKKIAIASTGEESEDFKKALQEKPDLILCACRTKGYTREFVQKQKGYEKIWITPIKIDNCTNKEYIDFANDNSSECVFQIINKLLLEF